MKTNTLLAALLAAGALSVSGAVQAQDASGGSSATGSPAAEQQTQMPGADTASAMQPDQMSEDDIRSLQQALADQGHDLQVDGVWGPNTETALRDFQEQQGIDASGQPDQETLAALDVQLNGVAEAQGAGSTGISSSPEAPAGQSSQ